MSMLGLYMTVVVKLKMVVMISDAVQLKFSNRFNFYNSLNSFL